MPGYKRNQTQKDNNMKTTYTIIAALALLAPTLHAASVTVDFNSLPTAQGWSYNGNVPQANIFSVGGGVLTQNSIGAGTGFGYFQMLGITDNTSPFSLSFRGRVLQEQFGTTLNAYGFGVQLNFASQAFIIGLGANRIVSSTTSGNTVVSTSIDTSQFHNYLFTGNLATHAWALSVDGAPVGTGQASIGMTDNTLYFGDLTTGPNTRGDWTQLSFTQVPEPSTLAFAAIGALALAGRAILKRLRRC